MLDTKVTEIAVPGDKSITHRALMLSAVAAGQSRLRGLLAGEDAQSTAAALRALGVDVPALPPDGSPITVEGLGLKGLRAPAAPLDCGNSGTTARLMLGLLSGCPFSATLTGDASLSARPMRRVTEPLGRMGARFAERGELDRLPIEVTGGELQPLDYESPRASAQIKSALLLAGLTARARVRVREPIRSRDHTERMLRAMGGDVVVSMRSPVTIELRPTSMLEPLDLIVPGDFSSAAFFIALALLRGADDPASGALRIHSVGVNPTRTGLLDVLGRMGARVFLEHGCDSCGEPMADLLVEPTALHATEIGAAEIPAMIDEIPVLAVLAARAHGETRITGAAELRVKESDRLAALATNLRAVGVDAEELDDGLVVRGQEGPLAGRIESFGDHRIAMAFGVLAAQAGNAIEVADPDVAAVSYPSFWEDVGRITQLSGTP